MAKGYPLASELVYFIKTRETHRLVKEGGIKPGKRYVLDPIIAKYRFCNIHREDDRVTRWIADNIRTPWKDEPDLWFAIVVCRLLNLPESIEDVKNAILPWKPALFRTKLANRKALGFNNFNAAYIVSTNGRAMDKVDYLIQEVLNPLWSERKKMRPELYMTLAGYCGMLMARNGLAGFMAGQIIADLKYVEPLNAAIDWDTFAVSGPGSRRGLNRVMGVAPDAGWRAGAWEEALIGLSSAIRAPLAKAGIRLHAQDLQNCLCEFDKYRRAMEGGAPKQIYKERK
jgi:hypothetical protein